ncbi:MAG: Na+/H+ antiporter subunit E [Pseudomonadota bacterium]
MRVLTALILFALWLSFSATLSPGHVIVGALISGLVAWLNPALPHMRRLSWPAVLAYQPWLFGRILKSGWHVSRLILHPSLPIKPKLIRHTTPLQSDGELVTLGNSITLTPGTVTVEIAPGEVLVHALDEDSTQDLRTGAMETKIRGVFPGGPTPQ